MTTATVPSLTMPLRPADRPDVPQWSPRKFSRAIEAERARTGEPKTQLAIRLAQAATTSPQTIYAWKKGNGRPGINEALALAAALHVKVTDLLE